MAEHDDQRRAELCGGELHAADLRRGDDVAGDADDEQVAEALVEHDFGGHPRVGAAEDDRERLLAGDSSLRRAALVERVVASDAGHESTVAVDEAFECFRALKSSTLRAVSQCQRRQSA